MRAVIIANGYSAFATLVLFVHSLFILWVVFGAVLARSRPFLRRLHIASLIWGIVTELLPWPCPLTLLENWLEEKAGIEPYQGGFLLHYLDKLVYPEFVQSSLRLRLSWSAIKPGLLRSTEVEVCQLFAIKRRLYFVQPSVTADI